MSFASGIRELIGGALNMLKTHIVMSSLIIRLTLSLVLCLTFYHALSHFSHRPNHRSYGFGSQENNFVPRCFGYGLRPHHADHFPRRHSFPAGGSRTHFEPRNLDGPRFLHHGLRPTGSNGEV
jgi:hypothetical protein